MAREVEPEETRKAALRSLSLDVADSIMAFSPSEWDALLAPTDYFRHGYLAALEASELDCPFHYAVLRAESVCVALGFGCLIRLNFGRLRPKVWIAGSPVNLGAPFAFARGYDTPLARCRLQEALFEQARRSGALYFLLRDFPAPGSGGGDMVVTAPLRLLPIPLHPAAVLPLGFQGFESYLASLKGSRRKSARRDIRAVEAAGFRLSIQRPPEALDSRLLELWLNLYRKHHDPDQVCLSEAYFHNMAALPEAMFLLLWQGEVLVAFDLCLRLGPVLNSVFSGIDPAVPGNLPVHRYLGYAIVRHAISIGCQTVDFGISNEAEKTRMGCRFDMLYGYGRPVPAALQSVVPGRLVRAMLSARPASPQRDEPVAGEALAVPAVLRQRRRVLVIGAGLGGLAAAARLASDPRLEVMVAERSTVAGGLCRLASFGRGREGFICGCNLFARRFFVLLDRAYGIRLPARRARILTYYDGALCEARWLASRLLDPHTMAALLRLVGAAARGEGTVADRAGRGSSRASLIDDIALLPFLLQGQAPWSWPMREGLAKLRNAAANLYPSPGLAAIPKSLERAITRHPGARIEYDTPALAIETHRGRLLGVRMPGGNWPAEIVVSSLPPHVTRQLLVGEGSDQVCEWQGRQAGLSAMAVFFVLDGAFPVPAGCHSLAFVAPNVLGQLQDLFASRVPARPSFELVCSDMAEGRSPSEGWRMTLFATCPVGGRAVEALALWERACEHLEQVFPGFNRAIRWVQIVPPDEYVQVVGCTSQLSTYADALSRACVPSWPEEGLYLTRGASASATGDTLIALQGGLDCASRVLVDIGHDKLSR